jgi:hypothetical protein
MMTRRIKERINKRLYLKFRSLRKFSGQQAIESQVNSIQSIDRTRRHAVDHTPVVLHVELGRKYGGPMSHNHRKTVEEIDALVLRRMIERALAIPTALLTKEQI